MTKQRIVITGATGLIGRALTQFFKRRDWEVTPLTRSDFQARSQRLLQEKLSGCSAVVNLAGEPVLQRWSCNNRYKILHSRTDTTRYLVEAINHLAVMDQPKVVLSASAVGVYPNDGGCYDESYSLPAKGFLAQVCRAWERELRYLTPAVRVVRARFATVLTTDGGALTQLLRPCAWGVATRVGRGDQPFAWIALEDVLEGIYALILEGRAEGAYNFSVPEHISHAEFIRGLAQRYNCPRVLEISPTLLRLRYGEAAQLLDRGAFIHPSALLDLGYEFRFSNLEDYLDELPELSSRTPLSDPFTTQS